MRLNNKQLMKLNFIKAYGGRPAQARETRVKASDFSPLKPKYQSNRYFAYLPQGQSKYESHS
jgi:hypothetical protein